MSDEIEEYPEFDFDLNIEQLKRLIDFYRARIREKDWGPNNDPQDMLFTLMAATLYLRVLEPTLSNER